MAFSSSTQGLHQVAQKSMMMGLPPLSNEEVLTDSPAVDLMSTLGRGRAGLSCAYARLMLSKATRRNWKFEIRNWKNRRNIVLSFNLQSTNFNSPRVFRLPPHF